MPLTGGLSGPIGRFSLLLLLTLLVLPAPLVAANRHPISITRNRVHVTRERLTAKIEVFVEDLFMFHNLQPNAQDFLEPDVIDQGVQKHERFLTERFVVRDVAGHRLEGKVVEVTRPAMQDGGIPLAEMMAHKLIFHLQYELPAPPEFLTFSQHFTDPEVLIRAEMTLDVLQEGAGSSIEQTLKLDEPYTMAFNWNNPPLSAEASAEEQEKWMARQQEQQLGITSYSSVYSFLYIDDYEVRHEILIPLLTLEESILVARDEDEFLDLAEQQAARQQIEAYFVSGNPIEIDGLTVKPTVQRCDFYGLDFKDFALRGEPRPVSLVNARVGIILAYETKSPPSTVQVTWNRFNEYVWAIDMLVFTAQEAARVTLSRLGGKNTYQWVSPGRTPVPPLEQVDVTLPARQRLSIPLLSTSLLVVLPVLVLVMKIRGATAKGLLIATVVLGLGAAASWPIARWETPSPLAAVPQLSAQQAATVFGSLHRNIYRAFDYHDENDIYDALAKSVDGELLNSLYLQVRRGLEMAEQGGAVSKIREVQVLGGQAEPLPRSAGDERGFRYRCQWTVGGTVEHWGHIHARTNQYEAVWSVQPRQGAWKITDLEILDEERIKFETKPRRK